MDESVVDESKLEEVEIVALSLESVCAVDMSYVVVDVEGSVSLLKSRISTVEGDVEPSKDVIGTDCVIVDVYTEGKSVGVCVSSSNSVVCIVDVVVKPIGVVVLERNVEPSVVSTFSVAGELNLLSKGVVKLQSRSPMGVCRHSQNIPLKSFRHEHEKSSTPSTHFPPFAHLQRMKINYNQVDEMFFVAFFRRVHTLDRFDIHHIDIRTFLRGNLARNNRPVDPLPSNTMHCFCMVNRCILECLLRNWDRCTQLHKRMHTLPTCQRKRLRSSKESFHTHQLRCCRSDLSIQGHNRT